MMFKSLSNPMMFCILIYKICHLETFQIIKFAPPGMHTDPAERCLFPPRLMKSIFIHSLFPCNK